MDAFSAITVLPTRFTLLKVQRYPSPKLDSIIIIKKHDDQEGFRMTMRAGRDIKKGAEITNSYVDPQVIPRPESFQEDIDFSGSVSRETRIVETWQVLPLQLLKVAN